MSVILYNASLPYCVVPTLYFRKYGNVVMIMSFCWLEWKC